MIVPTIVVTTKVDAQISTPASSNVSTDTTTYGPQSAVVNTTSTINRTAVGGIQDMMALANMLEPDIQRFDLVDTFNDVVYAFGYIQSNLTALQNQTNNSISTLEGTVGQLRAQVSSLQDQLEAATAAAEEETAEEDAPEEEEEEEPEVEEDAPEEEEEDTTTTPQQSIEGLVNNPRTDDEGDGGAGDAEGT